MRIKRLRCVVCLGWYSPDAHSGHCPFCGAYRIGAKHYALDLAGERMRELVSGVHVPLVLRHNYYTK